VALVSAALAALAAEPWVCMVDGKPLTSADLRARKAPAPTGGIGLVAAAVEALGECGRDAIVRKAGLAATTTDILLAAAVDTGLVARERRGRAFVYRLAPPA
jgi:hypothetical protein